MRKNKLLLLYLCSAIIVILSAYRFYDFKPSTLLQENIKTLNHTIIKEYMHTFDTSEQFAYIWGLEDKVAKVAQDTNETNSSDRATSLLQVTQTANEICIKKVCYRLLGIFYKESKQYVSFYSKTYKKRIKVLQTDDILAETLKIKKIQTHALFIVDTNSTREWKFDFFDVNTTQYKPKEHNETDVM